MLLVVGSTGVVGGMLTRQLLDQGRQYGFLSGVVRIANRSSPLAPSWSTAI